MRYADAGGVRIAYDDDGPRVDTRDGFPARVVQQWPEFLRLACGAPGCPASGHQARLARARGLGPPDGDFGHEELADDAMAVIEAAGVRPVMLVAQAHGGWPAIELRRRLGDRVTKIVVLSWLVLDPPAALHGHIRDAAGPPPVAAGSRPAPSRLAGRRPGRGGRMGSPPDRQLRLRHVVAGSARGYGRLRPARQPLRAAAELDRRSDILHLFSQPRAAGFLAGQQEFSAANPWFSVTRLNGVTHFPALEIPDATAAEIDRFAG